MKYSLSRCTSAVFFIFLLLASINVQGQDYEEWKENYLQEFEEFQNKYDKQFYEMLQQEEWKNLDVHLSPEFFDKPKPDVSPRADHPKSDPETTVSLEEPGRSEQPAGAGKKQTGKERGVPFNSRQKAGASILETGLKPTFDPGVEKAEVVTNRLSYFDIPIQYKYYRAYKINIDRPVDQQTISDFWKHLGTKDYPAFLNQCKQIRNRLSLNDYGYAQLLKSIGNQIYGTGSPGATLFTWFMLTQSGYGTRVAYNREDIYLLTRTRPKVLKTTYFTMDGVKYYAHNLDGARSDIPSNLYTYNGDYPESNQKELDLLFRKRPLLPREEINRTLSFSYNDTTYTFEIPINKKVIDYLAGYPKADLDLYFNSRLESETHAELISALRPLLEGKSELEQVNILLRFVQRAFAYKTDQEQFNSEKKMFPVESLYYPASDCDDRSILFAYLVEHLTGLDYILLKYPGHLTPAVHFSGQPPAGDPVQYRGQSYYVTDPTYINADAGMIMSDYRNVRPEVINL